ncbi:MAG: PQQ-binding-like beta-propeller repeat protein [Vicinamibacterales bacterium]
MHRVARLAGLCLVPALAGGGVAWAQGRGGGNWPTAGSDAQRTAWVRTDARISPESLQKPGFQLLWKSKLDNQPKQLVSLTQPLLLQNIISYKGFKALAFVGGSGDNVYAIDYDLNKPFWKTHLSSGVTTAGTAACPAALTTITRSVPLPAAAGGRGRGAPPAPATPPGASPPAAAPGGARGGSPGTLPAGAGAPAAAPVGQAGGGGRGAGPGGFANANDVFAISSGGMVHVLNVQTGEDLNPPIGFLPSGAKPIGSALVGGTLYAATTDGCGGAPNGVYALDLASEARTVTSWDAKGAALAGSLAPAFGTDGTIYVTTGAGGGEYANAVVALDPAGLKAKGWFTAAAPFVSAPVVFQANGRDMVAAAGKDGRLYVLDTASLGGADHKTPLATAAYAASADESAGALATWQDADGARWIAVPSTGAIVTFKLTGTDQPALEAAWTSRDLLSPVAPLVMNGVVFAVAGGGPSGGTLTPAQRAQRAKPAVLYALDAATGTELWNSGTTITGPVFGVGPSGGDGQVYVVSHDGTVYAFGMPVER